MGNTENADQKQEIMTGKEYLSLIHISEPTRRS